MISPKRTLLAFAGAAILCSTAWAQRNTVVFTARQRNWDPRATRGECTIRVWIDDEADVELRGDQVRIRALSGQSGRDDGTECTQPLPADVTNFEFKGIDGRGEVRLVQEPRANNGWTAVVNIRDRKSGGEGYTYRLRWESRYGSNGGGGGNWPGNGNGGGWQGGRPGNGGGDWQDMTFQPQGSGMLRRGNRDYRVDRLEINLRRDGGAYISSYGEMPLNFNGTWRRSGDSVDLTLDQGGTGRIYLRGFGPRATVDRVEIEGGGTGRFGDRVSLRFGQGGNNWGGNNQGGGWWGNNPGGGNQGGSFTLSQSGRGTLNWDGRNWNISRAEVNARGSRDVTIRLMPQTGREFEFRGEIVRQDRDLVEINITDSTEGRARGRATVNVYGNNSLDSLRMDGDINGRNFRADFRR